MKSRGRIAIGWSKLGDLKSIKPLNQNDIIEEVKRVLPTTAKNLGNAAPSMWNLYSEMKIGDQVIVSAKNRRRCVLEITGDYLYECMVFFHHC